MCLYNRSEVCLESNLALPSTHAVFCTENDFKSLQLFCFASALKWKNIKKPKGVIQDNQGARLAFIISGPYFKDNLL